MLPKLPEYAIVTRGDHEHYILIYLGSKVFGPFTTYDQALEEALIKMWEYECYWARMLLKPMPPHPSEVKNGHQATTKGGQPDSSGSEEAQEEKESTASPDEDALS
jgi:hypothetical protein